MVEKRLFYISGMRCTACSGNVEKRLKKLEGVEDCEVNFASSTAFVVADSKILSDEEIIATVGKLGFTARKAEENSEAPEEENSGKSAKTEFIIAAASAILVVAISAGHLLSGVANTVVQALLTAVVIYAGRDFYRRGIPALLRGMPDMDTLISCGSAGAVVYSCFLLFKGGDCHLAFDSAVMIIFLVMCGKTLEERVRRNTIDAVRSLKKLTPDTVYLVRDDKITQIPASELEVGNMVQISAGCRIPADGKVLSGSGWVDESVFTGETLAVEKSSGSNVTGGTLCTSGSFRMQVEQLGEDTSLAGIINMVKMAQSGKAPAARLADCAAKYFVCFVFAVSLLTFIIHIVCGSGVYQAVNFALSAMVISCPCALGLATPVAIVAGIGRGAVSGILFRNGEALERACRIKCAAFDKTGTITTGVLYLEKIIVCGDIPADTILRNLACAEQAANHPLARAAVAAAKDMDLSVGLTDFISVPGMGISVTIEENNWLFGSMEYLNSCGIDTSNAPDCGKYSTIFVSCNGKLAGVAVFSSELRKNASQAVARLRSMGIKSVMLSGDRPAAACAVAESVGIDEFYAGLLPGEKLDMVKKLQQKAPLAMIGDGVNDAPALARADIGIAIGGGADSACDAAGIVIAGDDLMQAARAVSLSRATMLVIKENLFWAFFYNLIAIPFAAGAFCHLGLPALPPGVCAGAMAISSLTVVLNAARLKGIKL